jgi:hypothetical protein
MTAGHPGAVTPDRYVSALNGADPLESMRKAPKRLRKLLKGLSEKQLGRRPAPGSWSIKEITAHLADGEVMIGSRYRMVASMERPLIVGYDQDALVEHLALDKVRTKHLLEDFSAARKANVRLLERLPKTAFARIGLHNERGEESLERMLIIYSGHDLIHEAQIERLKSELLAVKRSRAAKSAKSPKVPKAPKTPKAPKVAQPELEATVVP